LSSYKFRAFVLGVFMALAVATTAQASLVMPFSSPGQQKSGRHHVINGSGADVHRSVHPGIPNGPYIGHLNQSETFDVESTDSDGGWCYGMAYGNVNQHGWVLCFDLNAI
jgi:hypothetical protein